jgi:hydroxypyruvate reductase 1
VKRSQWKIYHAEGAHRIIVTKALPGTRWLEILTGAGCRVEVCTSESVLNEGEIMPVVGNQCTGAIGQLTEMWGEALFDALSRAGGRVYSNYAVGINNLDVGSATKRGIAVGNTPGVLTETTAELAVALTFAAARRIVEGDRFMREGRFSGWLPSLFLGELLWRKTVGIIGAGRIGSAYARMMAEGHKMDVIYFNRSPKPDLEQAIRDYGAYLASRGEVPVTCRRAGTLEELLKESDLVSLHVVLDEGTRHMIKREQLELMKENAILVNAGRGPLVDETALVSHCREHPGFKAALDVFENEPDLKPGLSDLAKVVMVPHIGSATRWTREGMAVLAALNVTGMIGGMPAWNRPDISPFLGVRPPEAAPSIVNADPLGIPLYGE